MIRIPNVAGIVPSCASLRVANRNLVAQSLCTRVYTLFNLHCSLMDQYLITSAIENLTPWLGPEYDTDTSTKIKDMTEAVWAPQSKWTRTLAVKLLEEADVYYAVVMRSRSTARPEESMLHYQTWVYNFQRAREVLKHKIDGGFGWYPGQPYPPFAPQTRQDKLEELSPRNRSETNPYYCRDKRTPPR